MNHMHPAALIVTCWGLSLALAGAWIEFLKFFERRRK